MVLKKFEKEHYPIVSEWWKKHEHTKIPEDMLSAIGLICYKDDKPICASWLYIMVGCKLAQIAWTTTNPDANLRERHKAVNFCIDGLLELAKANNRKRVICFSSSTGLNKVIMKKGLTKKNKHDLLVGEFLEV